MARPLPDLSGLRPAGSKRSTKREQILGAFLEQEGHLSADDLFTLVRGKYPGIGRATVYRTLQWMVDRGLARKVDLGEGRSRFEPTFHHPRHFHLICEQCHRSSEFLSSDVEGLMDEIASARNFTAKQAVVQILGICEECRTGTSTPGSSKLDGTMTELVFARDALRIAIATERSGQSFYNRAAKFTKDARGRSVFEKLANEEKDHLSTLEKRYQELLGTDPLLESRPTFLFFKGAANGIFAAGTEELGPGVTDHDTTAAAAPVAAACAEAGIEFIPGIEITAVVDGADVHVLGYFIDPRSAALGVFLAEQRRRRVDRVRQMIERLAELGVQL